MKKTQETGRTTESANKIDAIFLRNWREKYRWPLHESRKESQENILRLESLVKNNLLKKGPITVKDVLLEIVEWKTGGRFLSVQDFRRNDQEYVDNCIVKVLGILRQDRDNVSECFRVFNSLEGVKIAIASAFLRFLDPKEHRYGIIDKNVALFLNNEGITHFSLRRDGYVYDVQKNIREYQQFHDWLQSVANILGNEGSTYRDIYKIEQKFTPVDIEMAIFAYMTQRKRT